MDYTGDREILDPLIPMRKAACQDSGKVVVLIWLSKNKQSKKEEDEEKTVAQLESHVGCRDSAVVRALASYQCGPGSIPKSGVKCGLSLLVLYFAPRGFLWELRFPLSSKNLKFDLIVLIVNFSYSVPN